MLKLPPPDTRVVDYLNARLRLERKRKLEPPTRFEDGWNLSRFTQENLATVMADRRFFGRRSKRLRKKLAKEFLRHVHARHYYARLGQAMSAPLRRLLDYPSIGRQVFVVQPLPEPSGLPYYTEEPSV